MEWYQPQSEDCRTRAIPQPTVHALIGGHMESCLLTIQDVSKLLQVAPSWVREHVRKEARDRIPAVRLGKYWRFRAEDVLAWVRERSI